MTMSNSGVRTSYAGNGVTVAFAVPWQFFSADEIEVWSLTAGIFTRMTRGTHYTVTGGLGETGTITAVTAPAAGTTWSFRRATLRTQAVNYTNNDPFDGDTTEGALDRLVALIQENDESLGRTLRAPVGEAAIAALPTAALRAMQNCTFDITGQPTASLPIDGAVNVSSVMVPIVGAATLILVRSLLGAARMANAITDYGAVADGVTDDRAAIQAAINSRAAGEVVYLPNGNYLIGSDITMKPGVAIVADDPLGATLIAGANNVKLLKYAAASTQNGFTIRRLGFSAGAFSGVRAVSLDGTDSAKRCVLVTLEDLYVSLGARGIDLRFCADSIISGCRTNGTAIGNYIDQCADTEINGGWSQNGSDYGLYCSGGPGAYDEGLRATSFSTNGQAKGFGVSGQDWGQLTGCSFTTCSGGAAVFASATNWKATNCDFAVGGTPAAPGILIDASCEGIQIQGSRITLNTFGISALGLRHIFSGNQLTANTNVDINLTATKCIVTGNMCDSTGVATSIVEQATSNYNNIYGNNTNGTVTIVGANSKVDGVNLTY